jgi:2-oxoglutarate ferredoxin oxidoreductase subunit beta
MIEAAHGRAPAVATGVKRSLPDKIVFTYQGDGDLASIGMCETVHAPPAARTSPSSSSTTRSTA